MKPVTSIHHGSRRLSSASARALVNRIRLFGRMRGPTIRDVARHAGVSAATVSRVLNDSPLVVEPTRERVQAAVDELGYRLNATARNLSIGRAMAIGVVVPFFTAPSVIERLRGVVERLGRGERREYDLMLFDVEAPEQRAGALRDLARRDRVAGLLIISLPVSDDEVAALERDELPACWSTPSHPRLPRVVIDNVHGGELAAEHLLARGPSPDRVRRRPSRPTRTASRPARIAGAGFVPRWSAPASSSTRRSSASARTGASEAGELADGAAGARPTRRARSSPPPTCRRSACCKAAERLGARVPGGPGGDRLRRRRPGRDRRADDDPPAAARGRRAGRRPAAGGDRARRAATRSRSCQALTRRRAAHDVIEAVLSRRGLAVRVGAAGRAGRPGPLPRAVRPRLADHRAAAAAGAPGDRARDAARARRASGRARRPGHAGGAGEDRARVPRRAAGVVRRGGLAGRRASSATTAPPTRPRGSSSCWRRAASRARGGAARAADWLARRARRRRRAGAPRAGRVRGGLVQQGWRDTIDAAARRGRRRLRARRRLQPGAAAGRRRHAGGGVRRAARGVAADRRSGVDAARGRAAARCSASASGRTVMALEAGDVAGAGRRLAARLAAVGGRARAGGRARRAPTRLCEPDILTAFGLRTLAATDPNFAPRRATTAAPSGRSTRGSAGAGCARAGASRRPSGCGRACWPRWTRSAARPSSTPSSRRRRADRALQPRPGVDDRRALGAGARVGRPIEDRTRPLALYR